MSVEHRPISILGAGPAGLMAGFELARQGVDFFLFEAMKMPRAKACADIITSKAIREIEHASPGTIDELGSLGRINPIWRTILIVDGQKIEVPFRPIKEGTDRASCYSIARHHLDGHLWNKLKQSQHALCLDEHRMVSQQETSSGEETIFKNGARYRSEICLGAMGARGLKPLSSANNSDRHMAIGIRSYYRGLVGIDPNTCYLFLDKKWMPGGLYIAPLSDGLYNVNMVIRKDKLKAGDINLREELQETIRADKEISKHFTSARPMGEAVGAPLPLATVKRPVQDEGILFAGDSAGLIDLISANGIPQAMISGRLSAQAMMSIVEGLPSEQVYDNYEQELRKEIGADLRLGRLLSLPLSSPWLSSLVLNLISHIGSKADSETGIENILYSNRPVMELLKLLGPSKKQTVTPM